MPALPVLALVSLVLGLFWIRHELRSAICGITLSNGVEVLVGKKSYVEILRRYRRLHEPDPARRWDQAVLTVVREERPVEARLLGRTLGGRPRGRRRPRPSALHHFN